MEFRVMQEALPNGVWERGGSEPTVGGGSDRNSVSDDGFAGRKWLLPAFAIPDFVLNKLAKFGVDLFLVSSVAGAANEQIGAVTDKDIIFVAPHHEFKVVGFHFFTSRIACRICFS